MPAIQVPKEKWSGKVREIVLGATSAEGGTRTKTVVIGGETTLPFLHFEGELPHRPTIAVEIHDRYPEDWSPVLLEAWGEVVKDPTAWAKAVEEQGADLILLSFALRSTFVGLSPNTIVENHPFSSPVFAGATARRRNRLRSGNHPDP